jgi:hypothetical protein
MIRDYERAQKGKRAVSKRWDKPFEKAQEKEGPNKCPNRTPITQKAEAREQTKVNICTKPPKGRLSYTPAFVAFWKAYPTDRLMSKSKAYKAWSRLDEEDQDQAFKAISAFKAECKKQGPGYRTPHAATYLNEGRFEGFLEKRAVPAGADRWADVPTAIEPARDDFWSRPDHSGLGATNGTGNGKLSAKEPNGEPQP